MAPWDDQHWRALDSAGSLLATTTSGPGAVAVAEGSLPVGVECARCGECRHAAPAGIAVRFGWGG